jgi:thiamine transport system substrate-binding protein
VTPRRTRTVRAAAVTLAVALTGGVAACGGDDDVAETTDEVTIRLLTHDSFAVSDGIFEEFEADTGITVEVLPGGDAGTVVNQAILTKGRPQADVLFGVDSTFLGRALEEELFVPHAAAGIDEVPEAFRLDPENRVTPVDYGDVCINYDREWFEQDGRPLPTGLADLAGGDYEDLLVVQNPATSSPGLAFLLASVAEFGDDGWQDYWSDLRDNGVLAVDGWTEAYYEEFSASGGDRPLVVSYASSPPAEVLYADPPVDEPPTGVLDGTCYRQVEFAGILAGTEHEEAAGRLVDFMLSETFQEDVPLSMFVFPVRPGVELPEVFEAHAATPSNPMELDPEAITEHRERWIREWTDLVLR